ncbi:hypothetical protein EDB84DRAFT_1564593 [Lactarius hengduanensis]|nr:hypothetical protein EDB84DRAFT_1564593 [Lactarius hengduanensis]
MPVFRSGLGLLALVRAIRSIGHTLKSFILRCVLFWPHILHGLTRIWPLRSRTGPKGVPKKTGGQAGPSSFPRASGACEEYSTIYASRDFNRAGEPHSQLGPSNAEVLRLSPMMASQSLPQSPASSRASSLHGSPRPSDRQLSVGSNASIADSIHSGAQLPIRRLNNPLTLTHSRATSTQFAGAPRPDRSRPPSPSPFPHPPPLHQSGTPANPGGTQPPRDTSEGSRRSSIDINVSPPSRSPSPTSGSEHSTQDPSSPTAFPPYFPEALASSSDQLRYQPSFPQPSTSSFVAISVVDASGVWPDGKTRSIRLMHSEQVSRYVNKGDVQRVHSEYRLHPMEVDLPQYSYAKCPEGWVPATHPGGALYFYNAERRTFTDVYMYDVNLSAEIHAFAALLDNERTVPLPTDEYDLVLDIIKVTDEETVWAYYYVDHVRKTLFWQHFYECEDSLLREVRGVREPGHVKLRLESLYWVHWSLYPGPDWRRFPENASNELLGALLSGGIDSLTSKVSTSPYTVVELESMRDFIKEAESKSRPRKSSCNNLTRLLSFYAHWKFLHFHGQKASRQDRYKSIYEGSRRKRTILVRILSPILFFFPDIHLVELEKVWTDEIVVEALWKEFMQKLVSEWTEFVLYSTVMLAANVAFLAIPGVIIAPPYPTPPVPNAPPNQAPNTWIEPSPAQITSSISLVFSIGSIITGLLLIRRNRTMMTKDPKSALIGFQWYYLHGMKKRWFGLEPLAIIFSLTYALLMWSYVVLVVSLILCIVLIRSNRAWGFFVALLIFSFQNTSMRIWIPVGTAAGTIAALIGWCIANTWQWDPEEQEEDPTDRPYEPERQVGNGT